jgi:hypothetical protein
MRYLLFLVRIVCQLYHFHNKFPYLALKKILQVHPVLTDFQDKYRPELPVHNLAPTLSANACCVAVVITTVVANIAAAANIAIDFTA